MSAVGTGFTFGPAPGQAGHVHLSLSATWRRRRPSHVTWYVPPQEMQVVGVGLLVLVAIVLLHVTHLGLELVVAVLGGADAVAGGGG